MGAERVALDPETEQTRHSALAEHARAASAALAREVPGDGMRPELAALVNAAFGRTHEGLHALAAHCDAAHQAATAFRAVETANTESVEGLGGEVPGL